MEYEKCHVRLLRRAQKGIRIIYVRFFLLLLVGIQRCWLELEFWSWTVR